MLVHPRDIRVLLEKARDRGVSALTGILSGPAGRTRSTWDHTDTFPRLWTSIPLLQERIRTVITGEPGTNIPTYIRHRYGTPDHALRALAPGCGTGRKELAWVAAGGISRLDGVDISPRRIAEARRLAESAGMTATAVFTAADIRHATIAPAAYDLIIFDDALHHIAPLRPFLQNVHRWLAPGGLLVLNEFVGPSRFQWTDRQIDLSNALLRGFPPRLATRRDGTPRPPVHRPGTLAMRLYDPSEAAESAAILPLVHELFEVVEEKPYGGALLHLVFKDLAHHFMHPDDEARLVLQRCIDAETAGMQDGTLASDFAFIVARPRTAR